MSSGLRSVAWMTTVSGRLSAYLSLGGAGLLAGLLLGRPEPVALAAPLLLAVAAGLAMARQPELEMEARLDRERALEGEEVELVVEVRALRRVPRLDLELTLPRGVAEVRGEAGGGGTLTAGEVRTFRRRLVCRRWGGRLVGPIRMRVRDPLGFFTYRAEVDSRLPLRVYPGPDAVRRLVSPADVQAFAGNEVSRFKGEGIEFADIRPYEPGDRLKRVNWRASARRGQLLINEMRPERNADVVLFVDSFTELKPPADPPPQALRATSASTSGRSSHLASRGGENGGGDSSLDAAVRAAASFVAAYLRRRDRVGLVGFGGTLRWLRPGMGERQLYRLLDALIDTEVVLSYAWKGLEVIPPRVLPPQALVIALSPLLDERTLGALFDLRGRGYDLAVVEVSPLVWMPPGRRETERLAHRIWAMEREALRGRFLALGVPVSSWQPPEPVEPALAISARFRHDRHLVSRR